MKSERLKLLLALIAGAVNVLAFEPFGWWPLAFVSLGALFGLWLGAGSLAAARIGFAYGLGLFGVGTSWMYISLNTFGGMPPALAGFCILLLVMAVALFPAAAGWAQGWFSGRSDSARLILIMPGVWLLVEWLRGWALTGFPWLTTGYAMLDTPIAGLAPVGGVYLVSLLTLMSAGALLALLLDLNRGNLLLSLVVAAGWLGGWQLSGVSWTQPRGEEISVAVVQNNVPLMLKWDESEKNGIIADYLDSSTPLYDADLVVWPEAAVPDYLDRMPATFRRRLREHPADFVFGVLTREVVENQWRHFNSIAAFGERDMLYRKQHLVPFGEFLPLEWLFAPLTRVLNIPMSDFSPWPAPQAPLRVAGISLAASVCYEDAFPNEWRAQVPDSGVLLNLSEDTWFGDSLAPHQRLQMARFRSLESGRPMIRSSNNGLSSVINWRGGVDAIAPQFVQTVVTAGVRPRTGVTPYTRFGDAPALSGAAVLWLLGLLLGRRKLR